MGTETCECHVRHGGLLEYRSHASMHSNNYHDCRQSFAPNSRNLEGGGGGPEQEPNHHGKWWGREWCHNNKARLQSTANVTLLPSRDIAGYVSHGAFRGFG